MGDVPSFKNRKRAILDRNTGKMRTLTEPHTKQWMERCIKSFESQLYSAMQTIAGGTLTAQQARSLIVSALPLDDSRAWIPEMHIHSIDVEIGEDGADVIIERI